QPSHDSTDEVSVDSRARDAIPAIESELAAFVADLEPFLVDLEPPLDLRALAGELRLLPVMLDSGGCFALRPDGHVLSLLWDEPHELRIEQDERVRNIALYQGSLKYPGLSHLVPTRPSGAIPCPACDGTGRVRGLPNGLAEKIVCSCGGLGWLPKREA